MVKADLTRDYYGDLELQPTADVVDIKKQFKKLALAYHPDRNPGRETEVTAKFQLIQSAHEVLIDAQERSKYDNNRVRSTGKYGTSYPGSSGVRGNPWSDAGSQYPPPPKHPTARKAPQASGADRYKNFNTPKEPSHKTAYEGAGSRQSTYDAWERMRAKQHQAKPAPQTTTPGPGKTWNAPQPPPRGTPQSGQQESNARAHGTPPRPKPSYENFRQEPIPASSNHRRSHSQNMPDRRFMPNTPGGDEPAAPMGAYFTKRDKPQVAPELPAREPPYAQQPPRSRPPREAHAPIPPPKVPLDPLKQFRESTGFPHMEARLSTPYATHGGEKLNPFESPNIHRSRSTREPSQRYDGDGHVPRTGSDPNMSSPHRSKSFVDRGTRSSNHHKAPSVEIESDSSDDGPQINGRPFGKPRVRKPTNGATTQSSNQLPIPSPKPDHQRKTSNISQFRQWYKDNPDQEPPLSGFPPDGTPIRSGQAQPKPNEEPSMYAYSAPFKSTVQRAATYHVNLPTVLEAMASEEDGDNSACDPLDWADKRYPTLRNGSPSVTSPSGVTKGSSSLFPFEGMQRNLVDQLLHNMRRSTSSSIPGSSGKIDSHHRNQQAGNAKCATSGDKFDTFRVSSEEGSPTKKTRFFPPRSQYSFDPAKSRAFWNELERLKAANTYPRRASFSFNVNDDTFKSSKPVQPTRGFSNSAENITTKFSTEDWAGTFAAGADHFKPHPTTVPSRAQSGTRSRGRSPTKPRIDPHYMGQRGSESETMAESPGGTKFSAKEWADSFRPQTFAPPPIPTSTRPGPTRKRTGPSLRTTLGGNAAVVDDGDTSDELPLYSDPKPATAPTVPSPDAMEIDDSPATQTVPQFQPAPVAASNANTTSPKRAAAPSQSPNGEAALRVNFDDMKIQDLLSSLEMPRCPLPPPPPQTSSGSRPTQAAYEEYQLRFAKYMTAWDLYNKQFMLHLVARKNQNDNLGTKRWLDDQGLEIYRRGLREDNIVLTCWALEKEKHEAVVREWVVLKETMRSETQARPRKKTH